MPASKTPPLCINKGIIPLEARGLTVHHFGPFEVLIALILFFAVAAVAGIVADYKKRGLAVESLRAAIERGQQLDPQLIERLMAPEPHEGKLNPLYFKVSGIIVMAAGVGLAILACLLVLVVPGALYPVLGGAAFTLCIGVGLLIAARAVEGHSQRQEERGS